MKIFISWSGERSRLAADALRIWLPRVMQAVRPWMSDADISAGSRWLAEVSSVLDETSIGIICVTQENLNSPWLHFEAGALSKALDQSRVCPMGLNLKPGQISGPLSQFQAVTLDETGMFKVLGTLNKLMAERALPETELTEIFAVWWPSLLAKLATIPDVVNPTPARSTEDQLEEILQLAREQLRRENLRLEASKLKDEKIDGVINLMEKSASALEPMKAALGDFRSNLIHSMNSLLPNMHGENSDVGGAMNSLKIIGSQFPHPPNLEIDTSSLIEMADLMRREQVESKTLTDNLLSKPGNTGAVES